MLLNNRVAVVVYNAFRTTPTRKQLNCSPCNRQVRQLWIWAFRDSVPSLHLPSLLSPPSFPLPPSLSPGAPPPKPARGSGERCKLPQWGLGRSPSRQMIWCISEPKGTAMVATVFVHFHKNRFKFLYKHKTAQQSLQCESEGEALSGSRGKASGQGVSRGTKSPEAHHADDILQFNAQIC